MKCSSLPLEIQDLKSNSCESVTFFYIGKKFKANNLNFFYIKKKFNDYNSMILYANLRTTFNSKENADEYILKAKTLYLLWATLSVRSRSIFFINMLTDCFVDLKIGYRK